MDTNNSSANPVRPSSDEPTKPTDVDIETGADADGTPVENPSG